MPRRTLSLAEFHAELKAQNAPDRAHLVFKCPMCGTLQNGQDLINAGAATNFEDVEQFIGFSCVGRFKHQSDAGIAAKQRGETWTKGCNWTLGGLLQLHELEVITPDGVKHPRFEIASVEEAAAHNTPVAEVVK